MHTHAWRRHAPTLMAAAAAALFSLPSSAHQPERGAANTKPDYITGEIRQAGYDGVNDDLLTGGLGKTGLLGAAPAFANPLAPTAAELRRNAIHTNYRALIDYTVAGGFTRLYGPNIDIHGQDTLGEGKVAGTEYIAVAGGPQGRENVTLMVQVPASFDAQHPCIVSATSSGSRGIYGAIGTAGDWGLKHGCAVAYTDKGSGNGLHDLMSDTVTRIDGRLASATDAGSDALFIAPVSTAERNTFNALQPNRVAFKHAHSGVNPERNWGRDTLRAIEFAFYVLNEQFGDSDGKGKGRRVAITPKNTTVIASSASNGAGAALAAAELDEDGLIDGVAISEPSVYVGRDQHLKVSQGGVAVEHPGRSLLDYFTFANLYQPCASLSAAATAATSPAFWPPAFNAIAANRCTALRAKGLLSADTLAGQADEALARLHAHGWQAESDFLQQSHYRFATNSIAVTYANAYGRFKPTESICGFSMANTSASGDVAAQLAAAQAGIFSTGNGVPPTTGVNIVYNDSVGAAKLDFVGVSPSTLLADFSLDGALCLRSLATGHDAVSGEALQGTAREQARRVREGVQQITRSADLQRKPAIIVSGRNDTLIPVNHASRAYLAKNAAVEGKHSGLRYVEVTPAQHFDTFLAFGALLGYDTRFVPLHVYFVRAMDAMWAHLQTGAPLPPSQVVRATPHAAGAQLSAANVPPWAAQPTAADLIEVMPGEVRVPQ
jgi:hydroxybutyrate-dimer hydrolase